jgi:serine/threonine protein kinase
MNQFEVESTCSIACPTPDALKAYLLGRQSNEDFEFVDQHLETCQRCETVLASLDSERDSFLDQLDQVECAAAVTTDAVDGASLWMAAAKAMPRNAGAFLKNDPHATAKYVPGNSAASTPSSPGVRFRILRPHAKGGLGQVYLAHDEELRREVALKEIQSQHADNKDSRSRFLLEAEITGGLEHPGIVPVYGLGQYADGRPYYAMRFIRGDSLQSAIKEFHKADSAGRDPGERTLELRKLLGRFVDVCQAMQYAHDRGVLHRDLKPGNIMLGKYGETLVVDWGLTKAVGKNDGSDEPTLQPAAAGDSYETRPGSAIGTPAYMSPEQAAGKADILGPATDIYSLGATLYSLLTGKTAVEGKDMAELSREGPNRRSRPAPATQTEYRPRTGSCLPQGHGSETDRPLCVTSGPGK